MEINSQSNVRAAISPARGLPLPIEGGMGSKTGPDSVEKRKIAESSRNRRWFVVGRPVHDVVSKCSTFFSHFYSRNVERGTLVNDRSLSSIKVTGIIEWHHLLVTDRTR
jgi:hypothetical protein